MEEIISDFSPRALALAIEKNMHAYFEDMNCSDDIEFYSEENLKWFFSGQKVARLNRILMAKFNEEKVDAQIEKLLEPFKENQIPLTWHTGPSTLPTNLGDKLLVHGFELKSIEPGMAADLEKIDEEYQVDGYFELKRIYTEEETEKWCEIFARSFGVDVDYMKKTMSIEFELISKKLETRRLYLGYLNSKPVASGALLLGGGVAGIYSIGTLPEVRGKGMGRAVTIEMLLEARNIGYRIGTLHASPMGINIYKKIGFKEYCTMGRYILNF